MPGKACPAKSLWNYLLYGKSIFVAVYSACNGVCYKAVQKAIALSFPNTNAAPTVMIEAPLAKALRPLCTCTLAFSPYAEDLGAAAQCTFFENFFLQLC